MFHFPCISAHVGEHPNSSLSCPVCRATWQDVPLLASHKRRTVAAEVEEKKESNKGAAHDKSRKAYDDDESLFSPTATRFNPIPEEDDEEAEEQEQEEVPEFQGFFVNQSSSSMLPRAPPTNSRGSKKVVAALLPDAAIVSVSRSHESYVVALRVRAPARSEHVTAPLRDPARRAPIDLVTVLDVSGSMAGAKLQMLKRAMRLVISSLGPSDRLSIVAFAAHAKRLMPLRRMSSYGQITARRIVERLGCGNGTCVGDALRKATTVLEDRRERNPVASIMLLSDGHDERPVGGTKDRNRPFSYVAPSTRFSHLEIPIHESGFGSSRTNREPAEDAFAKCVGGLLSVVSRDLRLQLSFSAGEIPAVYFPCNGRPRSLSGGGSIRMGDLYAEEERMLLVELKVPASAAGDHHVLSVKCSFVDPTYPDLVRCTEQTLIVPRAHSLRSSDPKIQRLRNIFVSTKAVADARRLVEHNDCASAYQLLLSARGLLLHSSSDSALECLRGVEAELAKLHWRLKQHPQIQRPRIGDMGNDENGPLTPTSAWRAAEQLAKVAIMKKSLNRVGDLHGFENARF